MSVENISIKKCPFCAEEIIAEAIKCKHCGEWLSKPSVMSNDTTSTVHQHSNAQAPWRLVLLSFFTFGMYEYYWFYRNWKHLKNHKKLNIRPGWRTAGLFVPIYCVFLGYWQFKDIREYAKKVGCNSFSDPGWLIIGYIFLSNVSTKISWYGFELTDPSERLAFTILEIIFSLLAVWILVTVQKTLNVYWKNEQPELKIRTNFSRGEQILFFMGGIIWILAIIGMFIPE